MTEQNQITLKEALELVEFELHPKGWRVKQVKGSVYGDILGNVFGDVMWDVFGTVHGTIKGRIWKFIETPEEKLERLIKETGNENLLKAFNQLVESNAPHHQTGE